MLFNGYNYKILYEQFRWIYLQEGNGWLLLIAGLNLKSKSFTTYRVTLYLVSFWRYCHWPKVTELTWPWTRLGRNLSRATAFTWPSDSLLFLASQSRTVSKSRMERVQWDWCRWRRFPALTPASSSLWRPSWRTAVGRQLLKVADFRLSVLTLR